MAYEYYIWDTTLSGVIDITCGSLQVLPLSHQHVWGPHGAEVAVTLAGEVTTWLEVVVTVELARLPHCWR
jgi:hypothetical protein